MTRTEIAQALGVSLVTIYRWEKSGKSPARPTRIKRTRQLVYTEADLSALRRWMHEEEPQ